MPESGSPTEVLGAAAAVRDCYSTITDRDSRLSDSQCILRSLARRTSSCSSNTMTNSTQWQMYYAARALLAVLRLCHNSVTLRNALADSAWLPVIT